MEVDGVSWYSQPSKCGSGQAIQDTNRLECIKCENHHHPQTVWQTDPNCTSRMEQLMPNSTSIHPGRILVAKADSSNSNIGNPNVVNSHSSLGKTVPNPTNEYPKFSGENRNYNRSVHQIQPNNVFVNQLRVVTDMREQPTVITNNFCLGRLESNISGEPNKSYNNVATRNSLSSTRNNNVNLHYANNSNRRQTQPVPITPGGNNWFRGNYANVTNGHEGPTLPFVPGGIHVSHINHANSSNKSRAPDVPITLGGNNRVNGNYANVTNGPAGHAVPVVPGVIHGIHTNHADNSNIRRAQAVPITPGGNNSINGKYANVTNGHAAPTVPFVPAGIHVSLKNHANNSNKCRAQAVPITPGGNKSVNCNYANVTNGPASHPIPGGIHGIHPNHANNSKIHRAPAVPITPGENNSVNGNYVNVTNGHAAPTVPVVSSGIHVSLKNYANNSNRRRGPGVPITPGGNKSVNNNYANVTNGHAATTVPDVPCGIHGTHTNYANNSNRCRAQVVPIAPGGNNNVDGNYSNYNVTSKGALDYAKSNILNSNNTIKPTNSNIIKTNLINVIIPKSATSTDTCFNESNEGIIRLADYHIVSPVTTAQPNINAQVELSRLSQETSPNTESPDVIQNRKRKYTESCEPSTSPKLIKMDKKQAEQFQTTTEEITDDVETLTPSAATNHTLEDLNKCKLTDEDKQVFLEECRSLNLPDFKEEYEICLKYEREDPKFEQSFIEIFGPPKDSEIPLE